MFHKVIQCNMLTGFILEIRICFVSKYTKFIRIISPILSFPLMPGAEFSDVQLSLAVGLEPFMKSLDRVRVALLSIIRQTFVGSVGLSGQSYL